MEYGTKMTGDFMIPPFHQKLLQNCDPPLSVIGCPETANPPIFLWPHQAIENDQPLLNDTYTCPGQTREQNSLPHTYFE